MISVKEEFPPRLASPESLKVDIINNDPRMENVRVELENRNLWLEFYSRGTEMILTKLGRRMFPDLQFTITGLEADQYYFVLLDIVPADEYRHKYMGKCWLPAYKSDAPPHKPNMYCHPDSPALGAKWSTSKVTFSKLKLTNNISPSSSSSSNSDSLMVLNSMHRYVPRLHLFRGSDIARLDKRNFTTFTFPETTFVAVTAYQNDDVTNLKIKFNPFAKGFREDDRKMVSVKRSADEAGVSEGQYSPEKKASRDDLESGARSVMDSPSPESPSSEIVPLPTPTYDLPKPAALYTPYDPPLQFRNPFDPRFLTQSYFRDLYYMCSPYGLHPWLTHGNNPSAAHHYFPYLDPRTGQPGEAPVKL